MIPDVNFEGFKCLEKVVDYCAYFGDSCRLFETLSSSESNLKYKSTTRSRYTHKKIGKLQKKDKKNANEIQKVTNQAQKAIKKEKKSIPKQLELPIQKQREFLLEKKKLNLQISFDNYRKCSNLLHGATILTDAENGHKIWQMLTFLNCKTIGL